MFCHAGLCTLLRLVFLSQSFAFTRFFVYTFYKLLDIQKNCMNIPITPLGDRVLVEVVDKGEETRSGIIIPKSPEDSGGAVHIGTVVAVGSGRETDTGAIIKPKVEAGQKVAFSWGEKVEVSGKEYHLVGESSLLGILHN